jgi:hypothetical protein
MMREADSTMRAANTWTRFQVNGLDTSLSDSLVLSMLQQFGPSREIKCIKVSFDISVSGFYGYARSAED